MDVNIFAEKLHPVTQSALPHSGIGDIFMTILSAVNDGHKALFTERVSVLFLYHYKCLSFNHICHAEGDFVNVQYAKYAVLQ